METPRYDSLTWQDGRWHCDCETIHPMATMEIRASEHNAWLSVQIDSLDEGRVLVAHRKIGGVPFEARIQRWFELRWPQ